MRVIPIHLAAALLAVLAVSHSALSVPEIEWDWPAQATVDGARVHSEPNLESRTVGRLKLGARVRVRWIDSEWLEIVDGAYRDRFLSKKVLRVLARDPDYEPSPEAESLRLVVRLTGTDINLRQEQADGKSSVVGKISRDAETLEVRRKNGDWAIVQKPERLAGKLISTQFLEIVAAPISGQAQPAAPAP
jgi:hypothetical protein